jgi:hypothetical protein
LTGDESDENPKYLIARPDSDVWSPRRDHHHPARISHSVISIPPEDENFLRLNFYSKVRWRVPIDPTKHNFDSKFEIKTTVHKQAEWRKNLAVAR